MANYILLVIILVMIIYAVINYRKKFAPLPECIIIDDFKKFERDHAPVLWLDIRSKEDFQANHIEPFVNIPITDLRFDIKQYSKDHTIVVLCKSGTTSIDAAKFLNRKGYKTMRFCGGIEAIEKK